MLKPGKVPGMDGLVPKSLIEMADIICKSLAFIFLKFYGVQHSAKRLEEGQCYSNL